MESALETVGSQRENAVAAAAKVSDMAEDSRKKKKREKTKND